MEVIDLCTPPGSPSHAESVVPSRVNLAGLGKRKAVQTTFVEILSDSDSEMDTDQAPDQVSARPRLSAPNYPGPGSSEGASAGAGASGAIQGEGSGQKGASSSEKISSDDLEIVPPPRPTVVGRAAAEGDEDIEFMGRTGHIALAE